MRTEALKKTEIRILCFALPFLSLFVIPPVEAQMGLNVDPGQLLIQGAVPGKLYDVEQLTGVPIAALGDGLEGGE